MQRKVFDAVIFDQEGATLEIASGVSLVISSAHVNRYLLHGEHLDHGYQLVASTLTSESANLLTWPDLPEISLLILWVPNGAGLDSVKVSRQFSVHYSIVIGHGRPSPCRG